MGCASHFLTIRPAAALSESDGAIGRSVRARCFCHGSIHFDSASLALNVPPTVGAR